MKGAGGILVVLSSPWQIHFTFFGNFFGVAVTCVNVPGDAESGVMSQDALQPCFLFAGAVGDDDHPSVKGVADTYPAAVVETHPTRTGNSVQGKIK